MSEMALTYETWATKPTLSNRQTASLDKRRADNTSGHPGVWWNKAHHRWTAVIQTNHQRVWLGEWLDREAAIAARQAAYARVRSGGRP